MVSDPIAVLDLVIERLDLRAMPASALCTGCALLEAEPGDELCWQCAADAYADSVDAGDWE